MKRIITYMAMMPLLLTAILSCMREDSQGEINQVAGSQVTIVLNIPGSSIPGTRSMAGAREAEVNEVDIIAFSPNGTFEYHEKGYVIDNSNQGADAYQTTFKAVLPESDNVNLIIIANASDQVSNALQGATQSATMGDVLGGLQFDKAGNWPVGDDSYVHIPMAGQTGYVSVSKGVTISGVNMVRMLARIDVTISAVEFELSKIYLCNYNTNGFITTELLSGNLLEANPVWRPNLPGVTGKATGTGNALAYPASNHTSFEGEIYTFEAVAADDADETSRREAPCLILEGVYDNATYFYRIDFTYSANGIDGGNNSYLKGDYMPLMRNYRYLVDVAAASGIGYSSINEAYESYTVPSNLRTRILAWEDGDICDIVFDGQYMLGVSSSTVKLEKSEYGQGSVGNKIIVTTDYPRGWEVEKITEDPAGTPGWITTSGSFSGVKSKDELAMLVGENTSNQPRTAYVHLKAGRLPLIVSVMQMPPPPEFTFISVDPTGGDIPGDKATTVTFKARTNENWQVTSSLGDLRNMDASPLGEKTLSIDISTNPTPWDDREVTVWAEYQGTKYGETVFTQKKVYNITSVIYDPEIESSIPIPGKGESYTLTVTGNFPAMAVRVWDLDNNESAGTGGNIDASSANAQVAVTVGNNGTGEMRSVVFQYEASSGDWRTMATETQDKGNFLLESSGRLVSLVEAFDKDPPSSIAMTWAVAMGIPEEYNRQLFTEIDQYYTQGYSELTQTGCAVYSEEADKSDKGKWRLANLDELQEIYDNKDKIGAFTSSIPYYKCSGQYNATADYTINFKTGVLYTNRVKTTIGPVRCVRLP